MIKVTATLMVLAFVYAIFSIEGDTDHFKKVAMPILLVCCAAFLISLIWIAT